METFIGTISGILFGGILTFIASRYYYKKSIKTKDLSCFVQYVSEILTDIEPEVKKKLTVDYNGRSVESLYQVQFIIANTGDYPIRNLIKPLSLQIPNNAEVLDANIVHIEPSGRDVSLKNLEEKNEVEFIFPLLNSGEYFVAKLLIKGEAPKPEFEKDKKSDENDEFDFFEFRKYNLFKFKISVDDLPPELVSERLPHDYSDFEINTIDKTSLWVGGIIAVLAFIIGYTLFGLKYYNQDLFLFNFKLFFTAFSIYKVCIILAWLITLILSIVAVALPISELIGLRPKKKTKFRLPNKITCN